MSPKSINQVLSLIQPTGDIHLGNYLGAVKNWVIIQEKYPCVYGVADLHAMTMPYNPKKIAGIDLENGLSTPGFRGESREFVRPVAHS